MKFFPEYLSLSQTGLERRWMDFVELVSALIPVSMEQGSSYSYGVRLAGITLVRYPHTAHITGPINLKHRCRREPVDNRWQD